MMRTCSTASRRVPGWLPAGTLALALLLAGCGEGITTPPGQDSAEETGNAQDAPDGSDAPDDSGGSGQSGGSTDGGDDGGQGEEPVVYVWGLPSSDTSVGENHQGSEGSAYAALQRSCAEGAQFISPNFAPEYGFESPRNVLLFAAGVRLCEDDRAGAAEYFQLAMAYGTAGLTPEPWAFCDLFKVVRSVLEQRPPEDAKCGDGDPPLFKVGPNDTSDDPLTLTDESLPAPETDPETEADPELEPEPGTEPGTDPETETDPGGGTETDPAPDAETGTSPDTGTDEAPETGTETTP
jgi:hypothetical protein